MRANLLRFFKSRFAASRTTKQSVSPFPMDASTSEAGRLLTSHRANTSGATSTATYAHRNRLRASAISNSRMGLVLALLSFLPNLAAPELIVLIVAMSVCLLRGVLIFAALSKLG